MYLEHFGLSAPPFQFTASPTALFMSRTHRECLAALEWGLLHEPSGLTLLAGEAGVGKTTLICALLARQYREVRAAYLGNPRLDFVDLLASILNQLGIRGGRASKAAMLNAFAGFANTLPANERIAVVVDEAQALSDDALEDFRMLSNLERHGRKAAQIILAGQLELARRLAAPEVRHLNERIGARAVLVPLTRLESLQYIQHRLELCGGSCDKLFARRVLDYIVRHSGGVPRRINALCHNSLLLAYSDGSKGVRMAMARDAVADYDGLGDIARPQEHSAWLPRGLRSFSPMLAVGLLGIAGFVSGHALLNRRPLRHLRSMEEHTSFTQTPIAAAATIEPAMARGSTAPKYAQMQPPPPPDASVPAAGMRVISADAPASVQPVPKPRRSVIVVRGDTLDDIAMRYLGSARAVSKLMRLNPHIVDASVLYPGEVVYLPPESPAITATTADTDDVE
ncbi:MAG: AAA family ATPase [Candidatus Binataceae bacterium]